MNNYMKIIISALKQWVNENLAAFNAKILNKVDAVDGKGLSTEDFTTEHKNKLDSITIPLSDSFIPDNIARIDDVNEVKELIGNIEMPEVNYPVTSVNGQTGDVVIEIPEQKDITVNGVSPDESGNIQIEVGSGVSSWNDLTDKPFYEEVTMSELYSVESLSFTSNSGLYVANVAQNIELMANNTYIVDWDGTEYQCVATYYEAGDSILLGNLSIAEVGDNTGEPFFFNFRSSSTVIVSTEAKDVHSIKVCEKVSEVKTLDEKFVPEDIARVSDVFCYKKNTHHVIEWDGSAVDDNNVIRDNLAIDYHGQRLYKVSEFTPLATDFTSDILVTWSNGNTYTYIVDEFSKNADRLYNTNILIVYTANKELNEDPDGFSAIAPSTGLYLLMDVDKNYISKIEFDAITEQKLDEKFIPDTIARVSDIPSVPVTSINGMTGDVAIEIPEQKTYTINGNEPDENGNFVVDISTSALPHVTDENNGSFLRVVDGAWAVATIPSAEGVSF